MAREFDDPTIVVPVNAATPEVLQPALVELFEPVHLIVLGYRIVPEQTPLEQYRQANEDAVRQTIDDIVEQLDAGGETVTSTVVFTRNRSETLDRVADEYDADAVLTSGTMNESLDRVLVPIKGDPNIARIVEFAGRVLRNSDASVTVFHVADSDDDEIRAEFLLRGVCDRLREYGIDPDRIE